VLSLTPAPAGPPPSKDDTHDSKSYLGVQGGAAAAPAMPAEPPPAQS